jgi:phosphatidate cytidylyltransferase
MLKQRIITVAVLLPLFLAALFWLPNLGWALLMAAAMGVAGREWARLAGYRGAGLWLFPLALVVSALAIVGTEQRGGEFIYSPFGKFVFGLTAAFWIAIVPAWLASGWRTRDPLLLAIVGWLVLIPFWYALAWLQQTPVRLLVALGVVWTADIAAYFAGRAFGRHKMAPTISPGKTWEGALGAAAAVVAYWSAVCALVPEFGQLFVSGLGWVLLLTAVSIQGDLFESWMKRLAGVKDSGTLLPGHGGVLDRVDALTSTLPFAALYFAYPLLHA